jgi:hypothetical protein
MSQAHTPLSPQTTQRLTLDTEPFLSCDDCFDLVDSYVEALLADPNHDQPAMRAHLTGCAACAEEARSLLALGRQAGRPRSRTRPAATRKRPDLS